MEYECPDSFFLIRIHTVVPSAVAQIGVAVASRDRVFRLELTFSQFTPEQRSGRYSPASGTPRATARNPMFIIRSFKMRPILGVFTCSVLCPRQASIARFVARGNWGVNTLGHSTRGDECWWSLDLT